MLAPMYATAHASAIAPRPRSMRPPIALAASAAGAAWISARYSRGTISAAASKGSMTAQTRITFLRMVPSSVQVSAESRPGRGAR